jgi:hypothetical protein
VYSLGCLIYETLTGATPYAGRAPSELWHAHFEEVPPLVAGGRPDVDRAFATALAKRRGERFATCTEFADALCEALAVTPAAPRAVAARRRRSFGIRHVAVVAAVAAVAAGAATATSWLTSGSRAAADPPAAKPVVNRDFLAALPATHKAVKQVPAVKTDDKQAPAPPVRHHVATPPPALVTTVAARTTTPQTTRTVAATVASHVSSPPVARRTVAATPTSAATTTAAVSTGPALPPPPPQDSSPPLPPPPP